MNEEALYRYLKDLGKRDDLPVRKVCKLLRLGGDDLRVLYKAADDIRRECVGDDIHVRGILDLSNYCDCNCMYCCQRAQNQNAIRFRMTLGELLNLAHQATHYGCGTIIIRSGQDSGREVDEIKEAVRRTRLIRKLAVTLCIGELSPEEYAGYREIGCNRYMLAFETSNPTTFANLHPDSNFDGRLTSILSARAAGLQLGSGFLIGLPGQDIGQIAADILLATSLKLDMIHCSPFVPHPDTPLGSSKTLRDPSIYFKTLAILRLLNPHAHISAPNSFNQISREGRSLCLQRGCNVFAPNLTPKRYREPYPLFPRKPGLPGDEEQTAAQALIRMGINREPATGPGHSLHPNWTGERA